MAEAKEQADKIDIIPQRDRVLVEEVTYEQTEGGVLLTEQGAKDPNDLTRGVVRAVGNWVNLTENKPPTGIRVGCTVCYGPYAGVPIKVGGKKGFRLLPVSDILAIVAE